MGLTGRWVRYGADAATALRDRIAEAKGDEPLAPVTVVVPSNQVGVSSRRLLASGRLGPICGAGPGLVGVTFLTPYRLAELVAAATLAGSGRRPVSTPVITAAVRAVLADCPGVFEPVAGHPATESALVTSYQELRDVSDGALDALAARSRRAADVVRVHRATRAALEPRWYDEQDLLAASVVALDPASPAGARIATELGTVVVHLPQLLSRHAAALLVALAGTTPVAVLVGASGDQRADAEVVESLARIGLDLGPPPTAEPLAGVVDADRTELVSVSDAEEEARAAVRAVVQAVRGGTPLDRIAILYAARDPYNRLLAEHLQAAGIPRNGTSGVALAERLVGRTLLGALALPTTGYRRDDVTAWLTGAPVLHRGRLAATSSWDRTSRDAGIVRGRGDWDDKLAHLAAAKGAEADELADPELDEPEWKAERARAEAERAESMREFVVGLIDRLAEATRRPRSWSDWSAWVTRLLTDLLGGPSRRDRWPVDEVRAAERIEAALARLAALDDVEGPVDLDVFTRTLTVELESDLGRVGRFGDGVLVAPVSLGVGLDLDLLVVVGLAEGSFPPPVREDSLLPDDERRAADGELRLRAGTVDRVHHQFLASLAGAARQVLCLPRGDLRRSADRAPSRWALSVAGQIAGHRVSGRELAGVAEPWFATVASFDHGLRRADPATDQEHRLRTLLAAAPRRHELHGIAAGVDPVLARGVELLDHRRAGDFSRFDGNLAGLAVPSPTVATSATRLERWVTCPFAYFLQDVLRVDPLEDPEDQLRITPLDRGNIVHESLEALLQEVLDGRLPLPEPGDPWAEVHHRRLQEIAEEVAADYQARGLTGRDLFWRQDRRVILRELQTTLDRDSGRRKDHRLTPLAAELAFGLAGGGDAVELPIDGGRTVRFRGKADRIDVAADGTLHVVDYKTGKADAYKKLSADDPHPGAGHLQLPVYGLAARQHQGDAAAPVRADYWFVSDRGDYQLVGYRVTDDVLARTSAVVGGIVAGIEAGTFAPNPVDTTSPFVRCRFCEPDFPLGVRDLVRQVTAKAGHPAIDAYRRLVGLVADEPEPETEAT